MKKKCSVKRCENPALARGWCSAHYTRWLRKGDVQALIPLRVKRVRYGVVCTTENCYRKAAVSGRCKTCYQRDWAREHRRYRANRERRNKLARDRYAALSEEKKEEIRERARRAYERGKRAGLVERLSGNRRN